MTWQGDRNQMAPNFIVQCLEEFGDGIEFERLCNDIMHQHYPRFEPAGGIHDSGIDGLLELGSPEDRIYFKRAKGDGQLVVFQYSLQEDWSRKVKDTLQKLKKNKIVYNRLVLVTSQRSGTTSKISLQQLANIEYGVELEVHDQEFLRVCLEAPNNEHLVQKYFASYLAQLKRFGIETSLFANLPLAQRHKRRALVLLSSCARSREGQALREVTSIDIVAGCIYGDGNGEIKTRNDIETELSYTFGDEKCLSDELVEIAITELKASGRIIQTDNGYRLSEEERIRIDRMIASAYDDDAQFYDDLVQRIQTRCDATRDQLRDVRLAMASAIAEIFEEKGLELANALSDFKLRITLTDYPEINVIANRVATKLKEPKLCAATEQVIKELFTTPTEFETEYLFGIAESFLIYEAFRLDPHGRVLELETARRNIVFIDTDIIVQTFAGQYEYAPPNRGMLTATRNLGIPLYTLPQIIDEYTYKILRSHEEYIYMGRPTSLSDADLKELGCVFETYFRTHINTNQTWDQYIRSLVGDFKDAEVQREWVSSRLEAEFGILTREFEAELSNISGDEMRGLAKDISVTREELGKHKHDDLYETDATLLLLLDYLQSKATDDQGKPNSHNFYWFISSDSVAPRVWERRTGERGRVFPPQGWWQYVASFPASRTQPVDFATLMKSLTVSPARPRVPRNLLLTLIRLGVNLEQFTDEALQTLSDRLHQDWIWQQVINQKPSEISVAKADELNRGLHEILRRIEESLTSDVVELRQRNVQRQHTIEQLQAEKHELEQKLAWYEMKERRRERYERQQSRKNQRPTSKSRKRY